MILVLM